MNRNTTNLTFPLYLIHWTSGITYIPLEHLQPEDPAPSGSRPARPDA